MIPPCRLANLVALVFQQRRGDWPQIAGNNAVQFIECQADAMVGNAILAEIVGANAFAAIARAGESLARIGPFLGFFLSFVVVQAAFQNANRFVEVLVLALFVLALHNDARFVVSSGGWLIRFC